MRGLAPNSGHQLLRMLPLAVRTETERDEAALVYVLYHLECMLFVLSGCTEEHALPFAAWLPPLDPRFRLRGPLCDILARALAEEGGAGFAPVLSEYADSEEELAARLDGWTIAHAAAARAFTERVEAITRSQAPQGVGGPALGRAARQPRARPALESSPVVRRAASTQLTT